MTLYAYSYLSDYCGYTEVKLPSLDFLYPAPSQEICIQDSANLWKFWLQFMYIITLLLYNDAYKSFPLKLRFIFRTDHTTACSAQEITFVQATTD